MTKDYLMNLKSSTGSLSNESEFYTSLSNMSKIMLKRYSEISLIADKKPCKFIINLVKVHNKRNWCLAKNSHRIDSYFYKLQEFNEMKLGFDKIFPRFIDKNLTVNTLVNRINMIKINAPSHPIFCLMIIAEYYKAMTGALQEISSCTTADKLEIKKEDFLKNEKKFMEYLCILVGLTKDLELIWKVNKAKFRVQNSNFEDEIDQMVSKTDNTFKIDGIQSYIKYLENQTEDCYLELAQYYIGLQYDLLKLKLNFRGLNCDMWIELTEAKANLDHFESSCTVS